MARKCEEDVVPETKANFGAECKSNGTGTSGNATTTTTVAASSAKAVSGAAAAVALLAATTKDVGLVSPKMDDDADDILSMSLNKIDSPPPLQSAPPRTKGSSSGGGGVEGLARRKSNALNKVQSKSDSPLDGASVGGSGGGSGAGKASSTTAAAADLDGAAAPVVDDLCSTDEIKVFKDEGDRDDEKMSVEHNLLEEKSSLIDFTENEVS